jgi:hypothetical protein
MSSSSKVRSSVSELTQFIKEKCVSNLSESSRRGDFQVDDDDLRKIIGLVDLSVSQAYSLGFSNVESALKDFEKSIRKSKR